MTTTPADVLALVKERGITMVDLRFVDLPGIWQHATIPASVLDLNTFKDGVGFDGSSIRGFQTIHESDMLLIPDPATARIDPFTKEPTLVMICNVRDPLTGEAYSRDPRYIAQKAEAYLRSTGIADVSLWGPEIEFFLFTSISYYIDQEKSGYAVDSVEAMWNSGQNGQANLGYKIRPKEGYFPVPPSDTLQDIRSEITQMLVSWDIPVEMHHHEVAAAGQCEIDMRFDSLVRMADNAMVYKYMAKNVARRHNMVATFMPKPLFGDNGSGMHVHQSLWLGERPLFYDSKGYAELSQTALYYIGGLLTHVNSLLALTSPTTNSYKRLVPHYEAPVNVAFSRRNRSAAIRIPMYQVGPAGAKTKRIEFRCPDPSANPYLAFAAMLMAGLDGIQRKIDPVAAGFGPLDVNIYDLSPDEAAKVRSVPGSLTEVLNALEQDHDYLLAGGVFTRDLLETWVEIKRNEVDQVNIRPHPYEFYLYSDI
jgi:glutamine synthetase